MVENPSDLYFGGLFGSGLASAVAFLSKNRRANSRKCVKCKNSWWNVNLTFFMNAGAVSCISGMITDSCYASMKHGTPINYLNVVQYETWYINQLSERCALCNMVR